MASLPQRVTLPKLHDAFLKAYQANDHDSLARFNSDFSQLLCEVEHAFSSKSSTSKHQDVLELSLFSHNVYIASTVASKAQLQVEEISNKFNQQLKLLLEPTTLVDQACPSSSTLVLKEWSLLHMSHLFPTKEELEELASRTSLSPNQIHLWFRNARTRSGWSKLFAHVRVNKDHERLKSLLKEYESLKRHDTSLGLQSFLARDELLQLLDKVSQWFATTKQGKPFKPDSIRPWVKDVLSDALTVLRDKTAGALDSSLQKLPSMPSRKRARTNKSTPSPSPFSSSSTPIAGPSNSPFDLPESYRSLSSQSFATGSLSSLGAIPSVDSPLYSGSLCDQSSYSCDPSPASFSTSYSQYLEASSLAFSLPRTCSPALSISSLSPVFAMPQVSPARDLISTPSIEESSACNLFEYNSLGLPYFNLPIPIPPHKPELFTSNPSDLSLVYSSLLCPNTATTASRHDQSSSMHRAEGAQEE